MHGFSRLQVQKFRSRTPSIGSRWRGLRGLVRLLGGELDKLQPAKQEETRRGADGVRPRAKRLRRWRLLLGTLDGRGFAFDGPPLALLERSLPRYLETTSITQPYIAGD